jgi:hypothetical protein
MAQGSQTGGKPTIRPNTLKTGDSKGTAPVGTSLTAPEISL